MLETFFPASKMPNHLRSGPSGPYLDSFAAALERLGYSADMALVRLEEFEAEWGKRYPAIGAAWRRAWEHVVPFFAFAPGIRKMIYTTNAVEALHRSLRKIIKTRGSFPNDDAALKLLYLAIKNAGLRWRRGVEWTAAMGQFAIQFGSRFPGSAR